MNFNHDNQVGSELAVDLANAGPDDDLEAILRDHAIRRPELDASNEASLRHWGRRLHTVFTAGDSDTLCTTLNVLLEEAASRIYLTTHDDLRPHLHLTSDDSDVVARVKAVTAGGLAFTAAWTGGTRIGACRRAGCDRAFVDISRNGRRRYCSARCGNYDAVARYRADR